ncbi:hypothetical protein D3C79_885490 [compost metagenome]
MHHRRILQRQHPQFGIVRHLMPGNHADTDVAQHRLANRLTAADLDNRTHLDTGFFKHLLGQFARSRALFTHQQAVPGERRQRQRFTAGQRMVAMHRHHQRVGTQYATHQTSVFNQL